MSSEEVEYQKLQNIGSGTFGDVYLVKELKTDIYYAAKISSSKIDDNKQTPEESRKMFQKLNMMPSLDHLSILKLIGFYPRDFSGNPFLTIITEFCNMGSLKDLIKMTNPPKGWNSTKKLINIYGIASGMSYLHSRNIVHLDLKPENIMIDLDFHPKITDYYLSKINGQLHKNFLFSIERKVTANYIAPEILEREEEAFDKPADVYSFALIVFEIITGHPLFEGIKEDLENVPESYRKLIERCRSQYPKDRPTFEEIVELLKNDEGFITEKIDSSEFYEYVEKCNSRISEGKKQKESDSTQKEQATQMIPDLSSLAEIECYAFSGYLSLREITIPPSVTSIRCHAFWGCSLLEKITIPSSVKSIECYAFWGCSLLTQITIPSSITSIEEGTFYKCSSLREITIPSSVTSIENFAFNGCLSLREITIPSSVTSIGEDVFNGIKTLNVSGNIKKIVNSMFSGCSSLAKITIPPSVISIGDSAFSGCSSLIGITIPSSVTSIECYAFWGCSLLTQITIPSSITSIEEGTFYKCSSLREITIPSSVTSIENFAFNGCLSLREITIPSSVTSIGEDVFNGIKTLYISGNIKKIVNSMFSGCSSLAKITIPPSVISIGDSAFSGCSSLIGITIPSSVTSIKCFAFLGCSSLTEITIPPSVISIGDSAFSGCSSLTQISIPSSVTSIGNYVFGGCSSLTQISIPSSVTSIGDSAFRECSSLTQISIPSSVTSIGDSAFRECSSLTQISIPSSVTSIGDYAFYKCSSLTQIPIPSSVTSIGDSAFRECSSLTQISIPFSLTSIGDNSFEGCSSLIEIRIPASVTSIGNNAFVKCLSLEEMEIPSSVREIGWTIFNGCSSLKKVSVPPSVTSIGWSFLRGCSSLVKIKIPFSLTSIEHSAFQGCSSLRELEIPSSVKIIGSNSIEGCSSLREIQIPSSVRSIEKMAFKGCSSLREITIPSSVTSIGYYAFDECSSLREITIPSSVTSIGNYAFRECSSLREITIPSSVTSIREGTFHNCSGLTEIKIPSSVTEIRDYAFRGCSSLRQIQIPSSVSSIGDKAFDESSSLIQISSSSSSITSIENNKLIRDSTSDQEKEDNKDILYISGFKYHLPNLKCEICGKQIETTDNLNNFVCITPGIFICKEDYKLYKDNKELPRKVLNSCCESIVEHFVKELFNPMILNYDEDTLIDSEMIDNSHVMSKYYKYFFPSVTFHFDIQPSKIAIKKIIELLPKEMIIASIETGSTFLTIAFISIESPETIEQFKEIIDPIFQKFISILDESVIGNLKGDPIINFPEQFDCQTLINLTNYTEILNQINFDFIIKEVQKKLLNEFKYKGKEELEFIYNNYEIFEAAEEQVLENIRDQKVELIVLGTTIIANKYFNEYKGIKQKIESQLKDYANPTEKYENILYHGTKLKNIPGIVIEHFKDPDDNKLKTTQNLYYGKGIYATENILYASIYGNYEHQMDYCDKTSVLCCQTIFNPKYIKEIDSSNEEQVVGKSISPEIQDNHGIHRILIGDSNDFHPITKDQKESCDLVAYEYVFPNKNQIIPICSIKLMRTDSFILWADENEANKNLLYDLKRKVIENVYYFNANQHELEKISNFVDKKKDNNIKLIISYYNEEMATQIIEYVREQYGFDIVCLIFSQNQNQNQLDFAKENTNVLYTNKIEDVIIYANLKMASNYQQIVNSLVCFANKLGKDQNTHFNISKLSIQYYFKNKTHNPYVLQ
ncbi:hypothetical protein M9Y10_040302 [Tritrichomonas musculus]|uniref:Protein kinase domain-containing protein n=1 Tax=Tritrichomonas musculus TaxID=1915356 RepID=A0ABR2GRB6_9EUKA